MARPKSIIWFERLYLTLIAFGIGNALLRWSTIREMALSQPGAEVLPSWYLPTVMGASIVANLLFWYFIARRGSNVARWIYVVVTVFGLIGLAITVSTGLLFRDAISGAIQLGSTGLTLACLFLLFRPDTRAWFGRDKRPDLTETFS